MYVYLFRSFLLIVHPADFNLAESRAELRGRQELRCQDWLSPSHGRPHCRSQGMHSIPSSLELSTVCIISRI